MHVYENLLAFASTPPPPHQRRLSPHGVLTTNTRMIPPTPTPMPRTPHPSIVSICPERQACPIGSTSSDWTYCDPGYYCPEGTPSADSFPCPVGYFTNRTDLADASECYPCPLGHYCGGGGSVEADGPCAAGYYCPLRTGSPTDNPCPAGTFSNSTSLYLESQCEDCPPGCVT